MSTQPSLFEQAKVAANHLAHFALAQVLFFQKEIQSFRHAAERVVALNPMDGSTRAYLGLLMAASLDGERGIALVKSAMQSGVM